MASPTPPSPNSTAIPAPCWRAARSCPPTEANSQSEGCEAWYKCNTTSDYVIRWRCPSAGEEVGGANATEVPGVICDSTEDDMTCPPPAVCAGAVTENTGLVTDDGDTMTIVLVVSVSAFALVVIILMVVASYRHRTLDKRLRYLSEAEGHEGHRGYEGQQGSPRRLPLRYHGRPWRGEGRPCGRHTCLGGDGHPCGGHTWLGGAADGLFHSTPYSTGVYFSKPNHITRPNTSRNLTRTYGSTLDHPQPSPIMHIRGYHGHRVEPSTITGSFVYLPAPGPDGAETNMAVKGRVHDGTDGISYVNSTRGENYGYYFYTGSPPLRHGSRYHMGGHHGNRQRRESGSSSDNVTPAASGRTSIPIRAGEGAGKTGTPNGGCHFIAKDNPVSSPDYRSSPDSDAEPTSPSPAISWGQCPPHSPPRTSHQVPAVQRQCPPHSPPRTSQHVPAVQRQSTPRPRYQHRTGKPSNTTTNSTHQRNDPSSLNPAILSDHLSSPAHHRPGPDKGFPVPTSAQAMRRRGDFADSEDHLVPLDISYDSFRNGHLREVSRSGGASSSTLEGGFRQYLASAVLRF